MSNCMKSLIANGAIESLLKEKFKFVEMKFVDEVKYIAEIKYIIIYLLAVDYMLFVVYTTHLRIK